MSANIVEVPMEAVSEENINLFNQLPDEMLIRIFSELQPTDLINMAEVCRRFKNLVNYEPLWRSSSLNVHCLKLSDFNRIIQFPIKELELFVDQIVYPVQKPTDERIESPSFKCLDKLLLFTACRRSFQYILNRCKPKHLILKRMNPRSWMLDYLFDNQELKIFSMRYMAFDDTYCSLHQEVNKFGACTSLEEFDLGNSYLTLSQFGHLLGCIPKSLKRFVSNHTHFKNLSFKYAPMRIIAERCSNLRLLGVSMAYLKEPMAMWRLGHLEFLDTLRFCYRKRNVVLSTFHDILLHLHQVRFTIQFMIGDDEDVSEESEEELRRKLNEVKMIHRNDIDLNVQYMRGSKTKGSICNGALHYHENWE